MPIAKALTVFGLGAVELWAAVPAGLAMGLHPVATGLAAALGAAAGVLAIVMLGEAARPWLLRRHRWGKEGQHGRLYTIWTRYGVAGLGLIAPLLVGAPIGTALGLTLGAPRGGLLFWMYSGIVLWTTGLTLASALGLAGIEALRWSCSPSS